MNTNGETRYIDIQDGGLNTIFSIYNRATQAYNYNDCNSDNITSYLNLFIDDNYQIDKISIKALYEIFILENQNYLKPTKEQIKIINDSLSKIRLFYLSIDPNNIPDNFIPDEPNDSGKEKYNKLCELYRNYYEYIKSHKLTDGHIELLCQMSIKSNYTIVADINEQTKNYNLNSTNPELKKALERFRLGIDSNLIKEFLLEFEYYINNLIETPIDPDGYTVDNLLSIANNFENKKNDIDDNQTLLTNFIEQINEYIKIVNPKSNLDLTKLLTNIFVSNESNSFDIIKQFFTRIEINSKLSGPNKFFTLFGESNNVDLLKTSIKFFKYINVFRPVNRYISDISAYQLIKNLYNRETSTIINDINDFVKYNKSLNNRFLKEDTIDYININYPTLLTIIEGIPDNYLNFDLMANTISEEFKVNSSILNSLKTDAIIDFNTIDKSILNLCVLSKISNKELSGIKIFLYIYDCVSENQEKREDKDEFKLIHYYLTLNTQEKNEKKLIKIKKASKILNKLKSGSGDRITFELLEKIYLKKKIINPTLEVELKNLINNPNNISQQQKYIYNLLLSLSPEKLEWNIGKLVTEFISTTASQYIKSFVGFQSPVITLDSIKKFIIEKQAQTNPKWEDLDAFKIYSYFNFDCNIVHRKTLENIIGELKSSSGISEKQLKTLKVIIGKNRAFLEKINKSLSPKLDYFINTKIDKVINNSTYSLQLYGILLEVADQNIFILNAINFLKEKGITIESPEVNSIDMIYKMFLIYDHDKDGNINIIPNNLPNVIDQLNQGDLDGNDINILINLIKASPEYISESQAIKLFFATNKDADFESYDVQQELYLILEELAKSSTLVGEIIQQAKTIAKDSITDAVNAKLQSIALDVGFKEVPKDMIAKVSDIASTAKTIAVTAGTAFATIGAYKAVDAIFGKESDSNLSNSSLVSYEYESLKSKIQALVIGVGTTLTLNSAKSLFPDILSIVQDYIGFQSDKSGLPKPNYSMEIIGGIIMGGLTLGLQGGLNFGQQGGGNANQSKSLSLIERILNWIFKSIDKLFGFNGVKPEPFQNVSQTNSDYKMESTYLYLTSQHLGSNDVFNGAPINEYPDQEKILLELNKRYNQFNSLNFDFNPYFKLKEQDKIKIKKIIAKIVALELNLFKNSTPYTFVYALNKFLGK